MCDDHEVQKQKLAGFGLVLVGGSLCLCLARVSTWASLHSRFPSSSASKSEARRSPKSLLLVCCSVDGSVFDAEEIVVSTLETMRAVDEVVQYFSGRVIMAWQRFSMKPETAPERTSKSHDNEIFLLRHLHRRYPAPLLWWQFLVSLFI
eukprot:scaffold328_cov95-Skeletonema_dohrnii-CCMP3373.AAC.6